MSLPLEWIKGSSCRARVYVKPSLVFICSKLVCVTIDENVNIKLTLKLNRTISTITKLQIPTRVCSFGMIQDYSDHVASKN